MPSKTPLKANSRHYKLYFAVLWVTWTLIQMFSALQLVWKAQLKSCPHRTFIHIVSFTNSEVFSLKTFSLQLLLLKALIPCYKTLLNVNFRPSTVFYSLNFDEIVKLIEEMKALTLETFNSLWDVKHSLLCPDLGPLNIDW